MQGEVLHCVRAVILKDFFFLLMAHSILTPLVIDQTKFKFELDNFAYLSVCDAISLEHT